MKLSVGFAVPAFFLVHITIFLVALTGCGMYDLFIHAYTRLIINIQVRNSFFFVLLGGANTSSITSTLFRRMRFGTLTIIIR